jgi:hypothetical protein
MNHVITPFSRWDNFEKLRDMMREQKVEWHLIVDEGSGPFQSEEEWLHYYYAPKPPWGFFIGHWLYNWWIDYMWDAGKLKHDDHYNLITDDDFFEPGMFDKIRELTDPIIVTSMNRGRWGVLWATPEHMHVGSVGLEQMHIRGDILKQYRLAGFYEGDGFMIEALWREHPEKFKFVPDAQCYFNYLPPGKPHLW